MTPIAVGGLGIAVLLAALFVRVPIGVALGVVSIGGIWILRGPTAAFGSLGTLPYEFSASWVLSALPMFLLMGAFAYHLKLTDGLYSAARVWFGNLPGGLAIASNFACATFAAASGSSVATTAAMGRLAIPEMLRIGYDKGLATGVVAAAGTLGALIPPSVAFVIYGWYAEVAVDKLLISGILPGLLTAGVYAAMIVIRVRADPTLAPAPRLQEPLREKIRLLADVWPLPVLIASVVGSIYSGAATATEAAAVGALAALLVGLMRARQGVSATASAVRAAIAESLRTTSSIFFIIIGAVLFTRFLALTGVPGFLAATFNAAELGPLALVLVLVAVYVLLGMFLDPIGVMMLTLPILIPVCKQTGMDLIWIGVLVVKLVEVGMLTPPVGLHCFVVKSIVGDQVPLNTIFRGVSWFLMAEVLILALLVAFPAISLTLPRMME